MPVTTSTRRGLTLLVLGAILGCDGSAIRQSIPKGTTSSPTSATRTVTGTTTTTDVVVPPPVVCPEGFSPCTRNGVVRCVDLTRSTSDCGRCGNACEPGIACAASTCQQHRCMGDVTFQALPGIVTIDVDSIYFMLDLCSYRPVLGDFNRDGILDFVGVSGIRAPMGMLLGKGDGTFRARPPLAADFADGWLASTTDLNQDGWPDLVNIQAGHAKVWVRLGNGDPASIFAAPAEYDTVAPPDNVLLADLDSDGIDDMAVGAGNTLQRWRGDGSGAFVPVAGLPLGSPAKMLLAMDYNGDSMLDVVYGDTALRMLLNLGPGTFSAPVACGLALDRSPVRSLREFADLDHDGKIDLVSVTHGILLGLNGCTFRSLTMPSDWFPATARSIHLSDLNADGHLDIVTRSWHITDATSLLLGTGNGTFAQAQSYPTFGHQDDTALLTGDVNGDTKLDLIVFRRDGWQVLLNTCR